MEVAHYQRLISSLQKGDEKVIAELYDSYSDALFGIIHRIIPDYNLASDCLQEVFVKIWERGSTFNPDKGRLFTWMSRIAKNTALNTIESKSFKNQKKIQTDEKIVSINERFATSTVSQDLFDLNGIVSQLPDKYRLMIEYCYFRGYTQKEISDELEIPLGTVKTRIKDALKQLRKIYGFEIKNIAVLIMIYWMN